MILGIDASRVEVKEKTGVEWYANEVIRGLAKYVPSTWRVILYTRTGRLNSLGKLPSNWEVLRLRAPFSLFWTQIRLSLHLIRSRPDILFVPSHIIPVLHPQKTLTTIHDIAFLRFPQAYSRKERLVLRFGLRLAKHSARILVPSNFTKEELTKLGFSPAKIFVTPLGIDRERYRHYSKQEIAETSKQLGITKPYVLFLGRLELKKNVLRLLEAWEQGGFGEKYTLMLVGKKGLGGDEILSKSRRLPGVKILGWLEEELLTKVLSGASLLVLPSLYEGFGLPVLQAGALGIPVVASSIPPIAEILGEAAVYVNPLQTSSIRDGIRRVLSDKALQTQLRDMAIFRAKRFSWDRTASLTWKIIESLV